MRLKRITPPEISDDTIADIVRKIVDTFFPEKIILFGSRVWGDPGEWSDIDILVIMDFHGSPSRAIGEISIAARPQFVPVDILVRTPQEIEDRLDIGDHFIRKIMTEGKVLYERGTR